MNIEIKKNGGNTEIILEKRLDAGVSPEVDEALQKEIGDVEETLTLNMEKVDYISSMGLRVLVAAHNKLKGKRMILKNPSPAVKYVLELTGLTSLFTLE